MNSVRISLRKVSFFSYTNAVLAIGAGSLAFSCQTKNTIPPPNVLLILSDDHSPAAISAYGQSLIKTPNIDRIAANGIRFSNCFNVVSLSAPSRAAILTGKYSAINKVFKIGNVFDSTQTTFPKIMHDAGYQTALFGKWHLRSRPVGFDYFNIIHDQGSYYNCPVKNSEEEWTMGPGNNVVPEYLTGVLTDQSIQWLENRDRRKPFCLLLHHKAPHHPWIYPEKYDSLFANKDLPEPETFNDDYNGKNQYIRKEPCRFSKLQYVHSWHFEEPVPEGITIGSEDYKKWAYQKVFKGYYRLVASLDDNIGRLLDYLQKTGLDKNTVIIYMSDNGFFLGDHGLFNKQWMYDESIRIPLIISLPGKDKKEEVINKIVSELDLASTILDYAHLEIPADFQGQSLKPLIEGKLSGSWRKSHFYHYFRQYEVPENYGIRTEKFKLINTIDSDFSDWEFYDLENDPKEMNNQINNPAYKQTIDSLRGELFYAKNNFESVPVISK
jgi:arylsulfatase A-like enzyme